LKLQLEWQFAAHVEQECAVGSLGCFKFRKQSDGEPVLRLERGEPENAADVSNWRAFALACAVARLYQANRV